MSEIKTPLEQIKATMIKLELTRKNKGRQKVAEFLGVDKNTVDQWHAKNPRQKPNQCQADLLEGYPFKPLELISVIESMNPCKVS